MSLVTNLTNAFTRIGTEFKTIRTMITGTGTGDLTGLTTTAKTSVVAAINEVKAATGAVVGAATTTTAGIVQLATPALTVTGLDTTKAVTPAGVKASVDALINAAPGTMDTLGEIATQLAADESAASALTTTVAGKQPIDADLTAIAALASAADKLPYATGPQTWALTTLTAFARSLLDDPDVATMQTTLGVYSQTQIGDPTTDFVATFNAALL
jgi:hypothetical protein